MFTLPDLPYDYAALEPYVDEQTMRIHHDKHHAAYVENLNKALEGLQQFTNIPVEQVLMDITKVPETIRTKIRNHGGGHSNHSLFWQIMAAPDPKGAHRPPQGDLGSAIKEAFGGFEKFQEQFSSVALNRFGSGWAWLSVERGVLKIEDSANQDSPLMEGRRPILGLDVWEHAYYLKYQNKRAEYIKNWWNVVNWKEVERRFHEATK